MEVLKKIIRPVLGAMLALALMLGITRPAAAQEPLRIDFPEFWPFFATEANGQIEGFFHDIVTEALARMDVKATWTPFPWPRCQEHVRTGEADAMVTVPTPERLYYAKTHTDPFYRKDLKVFTYKGHPRIEQIRSIRSIDDIFRGGFSVVTYSGNGWNDKHIKVRGIKTYETPKLENVWRMLANRRGDIAIEWPGGAWPDIIADGVEKLITQTDVTLESMPFHLMIRRTSPYADRLPEFNQVILNMKKDGTLDRIVDKYIKQYQADPDMPPLTGPQKSKEHLFAALSAN